MIKCDVHVKPAARGNGPCAVKEKLCHLVYFPLVRCLFQPIGRDDNRKILRRPRPHSGRPLQSGEGPQRPLEQHFCCEGEEQELQPVC